jgi:CRISPR/Cas system-associated exonuclease Cas4 (RecB family)
MKPPPPNVLTFSMSSRDQLEECPRKFYLSKYVAHNGWHDSATPECRDAYTRKSAHNRYSYPGDVVHRLITRAINAGVQPGEARGWMQERAREIIAHEFNESLSGAWKSRKAARIMEHERGERLEAADVIEQVNRHVRALTGDQWQGPNLFASLLAKRDRIDQLDQLVQWDGLGMPMWLAVDVLARGKPQGQAVIIDWKTGKPKPEHARQVMAYGAYAQSLGFTSALLILVYTGQHPVGVVTDRPDLEECRQVADDEVHLYRAAVAGRLEGGDIAANVPQPAEAWEPKPSGLCRFCAFREVCPAGNS